MTEISEPVETRRTHWRPAADFESFKASVLALLADYKRIHPVDSDRSFTMDRDRLLEWVIYSRLNDWERLPSDHWLEARHVDRPDLHLTVRVYRDRRGRHTGRLLIKLGSWVLDQESRRCR